MAFVTKQTTRSRLPRSVTPDDHAYVRSLSRLDVTVRRICELLGERFGLGKPLSRLNLYWHFRGDLLPKSVGKRHRKPAWQETDAMSDVQKLLTQARGRAIKKTGSQKLARGD